MEVFTRATSSLVNNHEGNSVRLCVYRRDIEWNSNTVDNILLQVSK